MKLGLISDLNRKKIHPHR
uniref:Uncharacterized protein n=1 Tax=Rhizophora mucronata TaxID=61149 RepID=A0A2P2NDP8_RHIMU